MADANNHISYSLADIQRYLQGSMSAKEMHDLERAALEDPFLADALEGYSEADMQQAQQHLGQIETAIRQQKQESKIVALLPLKKYRSWQVAASVILLAGIVGVTYFIFNKKGNEVTLAKTESRSAIPATDSAQVRMQAVSPPTADTTVVAKKEQIGEEKSIAPLGNILADNKRKNKKELRRPTVEVPVPMAAMKEDSGKTGLSANSTMAKRDSAYETARTNNGNQQQLSASKPNPSIADKAAISAGAIKTDTGKARISARVKQVPSNGITGIVVDEQQKPVPNASVQIRGTTRGATTDENGGFSIPTYDSTALAVISALGYQPKDQQLRGSNNKIILSEGSNALAEVVTVVGIKRRKAADTTAATPQGGWQSFQEYVYNELRKKYDSTALPNNYSTYTDDSLELEFSIKKSGEPFDFKVLDAPDIQIADAAIGVIKAGPKWVGRHKNGKVRIIVRYK